jgi:hypothetical protein
VESFAKLGEEFDKKGKGLNPTSLSELWRELAGVVQRYFTCYVKYDVVRPLHLKLFTTLKQWLVLNIPFLLNNILHEAAEKTRKVKDPDIIINHHGMVKLIVFKALNHAQMTWEYLIELNRPL